MSALQRKAQSGRQEHQARAMSVPKALRLATARVADRMYDLALAVIGVTQDTADNGAMREGLEDTGLMLLLDGPDRSIGAAVLDLGLVSSLIQQQTTGTVSRGAPAERGFTSTDAALCAPFLDSMLSAAVEMLPSEEERRVIDGFAFGARVDNRRLLEMALEAPDFHVIRLTLDIAGGLHQGALSLYLPQRSASAQPVEAPDLSGSQQPSRGAPMENVVLSLNAELSVVLHRLRLPLSRLGTLSPGDVLALPPDTFPHAQVTVPGGRVLACGVLGQVEGKRALRLAPRAQPGSGPQRRRSDRDSVPLPEGLTLEGSLAQGDGPGLDPALAELASLPGGAFDMPDLPDQGGLPDTADLPDLGDLPDLSDLPELDDLPDLGDLPKIEID